MTSWVAGAPLAERCHPTFAAWALAVLGRAVVDKENSMWSMSAGQSSQGEDPCCPVLRPYTPGCHCNGLKHVLGWSPV